MKLNNKLLLLVVLMAFGATFILSSGNAMAYYSGVDGGYVGSQVCAQCHADEYNDFIQSGHPWKFRQTNGQDCSSGNCDALSNILPTPAIADINTGDPTINALAIDDGTGHLDWSAIQYVIGGYGWKARFGVKDINNGDANTGYIWTGSAVQYNVLAADPLWDTRGVRDRWSKYDNGSLKEYACAQCHNTNGDTPALDSKQQPSTPGNGWGSNWTFEGVQCEACHGPGEVHANNPTPNNIKVDTSKELCGQCHNRSGKDGHGADVDINVNVISGRFIRHHEQYNELVGSPVNGEPGAMAILDCVDCHDPHKRAHALAKDVAQAIGIDITADTDNDGILDYQEPAPGAIKKKCKDCHKAEADADAAAPATSLQGKMRDAGVTCEDCHMAEAMKSATSETLTNYGKMGDVKSHIFAINTDPNAPDTAAGDITGNGKPVAHNYLSLQYACGKCHDLDGASMPTGYAAQRLTSNPPQLLLTTVATEAENYHNVTGIDGGYVGSEACKGCHADEYADWSKSGHAYKFRQTYGQDCSSGNCDALSNILPTPAIADINTGDPTINALAIDDGTRHLDWSAIQYVIGGYGWKARFGVKDFNSDANTGYIWTGSAVQYNVLAQSDLDPTDVRPDWSPYHDGELEEYACAECHNTNGDTPAVGGKTQPDTTGAGWGSDWTFDSVQCEACHGPGVDHVQAPDATNINTGQHVGGTDYTGPIDSKELCGYCHNRSGKDGHGADVKDGYIRHHEQYNELVGSKDNGEPGVMAKLDCVDCHDPHKRAHKLAPAVANALGITDNDKSAVERGAVVACGKCHPGKGLNYAMPGVTCTDCHMAEAMKSATAEGPYQNGWGKMGDVKSHIFAINIDPAATDTAAGDITGNGKPVAHNYISLNYACGKCHDSTMSTFVGVSLSLDPSASNYVGNYLPVHPDTPVATGARFNWSYGSSCYEVDFDASDNHSSTYSWNFGDGSMGTGAVISHIYPAAGEYTVTLKTDTGIRSVKVEARAVHQSPDVGMAISFDPSDATGMTVDVYDYTIAHACDASDQSGTATIIWGDGTSDVVNITAGTGMAASHQYKTPGTYIIHYSFKDADGNKASAAPQTITVPNAAVSVFNVSGDICIDVNADNKCTISGTCSINTYTNKSDCESNGGIWTWDNDTPVANATIYLKNGYTTVKMGKTDENGHYVMYSVPELSGHATYTVVPDKNGYTFSAVTDDQVNLSGPTADFTATSQW